MVIRIYVEGGGDNNLNRSKLREGFNTFLNDLIVLARDTEGVEWGGVRACGSRGDAYEDFRIAVQTNPDAFNVLLVDSETPVEDLASPWKHLKKASGKWNCPAGVSDEQCFLMVQCMETWLIADHAALRRFYGKGFQEAALPRNPKVEEVPKKSVEAALKKATAATTAGEYHKTKHGLNLLKELDTPTVRKAAPSCDRLFTTLTARITDR